MTIELFTTFTNTSVQPLHRFLIIIIFQKLDCDASISHRLASFARNKPSTSIRIRFTPIALIILVSNVLNRFPTFIQSSRYTCPNSTKQFVLLFQIQIHSYSKLDESHMWIDPFFHTVPSIIHSLLPRLLASFTTISSIFSTYIFTPLYTHTSLHSFLFISSFNSLY